MMPDKHNAIQTLQKVYKSISKPEVVAIDNLIFKLHYQWTALLLLLSSTLVTLQHYFGNHIDCLTDSGVPTKVINTFCFFKTTFTIIKHFDESNLQDKIIPHPGIGPNTEEDKNYTTCLLSMGAFPFISSKCYVLYSTLYLEEFRRCISSRLHINRPWTIGLVSCEILNAINLCFQIYILDVFLGGSFINLGVLIYSGDFSKEADPLDFIFPKITKCLFHKYGPSGSIQRHDALCVMSLNVVNEKIYTFFWFWFLFLTLITIAGLLWRLLAFILHSRSDRFNAIIFRASCPKSLEPWNLIQIMDECHFSDWLFLRYLSKNLDDKSFRELFHGITQRIIEKSKPERINFYDNNLQSSEE
ncbi:hypothetical protein L9F63_004499 [Diploptera punctata]|uniref:Innexin n=1 Tax=Diploptera punctata TaxID=6984 RepID=A0AAD7ZFV9_DIPPU|nr:hypothetical protein L9F63_004499 [Diploptera punctata]